MLIAPLLEISDLVDNVYMNQEVLSEKKYQIQRHQNRKKCLRYI